MIQSSKGMNWEENLMIGDELKCVKKKWSEKHLIEEMQFKTVLTLFDISAISGATYIRLKWSLYHFKAKRQPYIWYEYIEIQFYCFHGQKVEIQKLHSMDETETGDWPVVGISIISQSTKFELNDSWSNGKII